MSILENLQLFKPEANKAGKPAPAAADAKPEATDDSCKSLVTSTNDYWCATQCANDKGSVACPPTICKCDSHA